MLFNSYHFLLFFPIVIAIYFIIPRKTRYIWLLISSYYFYMSWNVKYAILIAFSTFCTYIGAILIDKVKCTNKRNWKKISFVSIIVVINIGILFVFKYLDFFILNLNAVLGKVNISIDIQSFSLLLPVGISFYTFQALGYIIDVYRKEVKVERNIFKYALFVSFFPQLVAGPIERSKDLLTQIQQVHTFKLYNYERITKGFVLIIWGMFMKMVIADRAAIFVNTIHDSYWRYGSIELIIAMLLFSLQIYCDFASYSMIAIGAANVMGFSLMENFNTPYFARSIKEFWQRWHISLSTWFRDYLYIPLGGNRCSRRRNYFNIMLTFFVSGLWHGANWGFIIWGGLHGLYQIIGNVTVDLRKKIYKKLNAKTECFSFKLGQGIFTFILVSFTWIFFRTRSISGSMEYIYIMITKWNPWVLFDDSIYNIALNQIEWRVMLFSITLLIVVDSIRYFKQETIDVFLETQCLWFRWFVIILLIVSTYIFGIYGTGFEASEFIYFQF